MPRWIHRGAALLALVAGCNPTESQVRAEISAGQTCAVAAECVDLGAYCPFGCNIVVHRDQADRIRALLVSYRSDDSCVYDCAALQSIACEAGRCMAKY